MCGFGNEYTSMGCLKIEICVLPGLLDLLLLILADFSFSEMYTCRPSHLVFVAIVVGLDAVALQSYHLLCDSSALSPQPFYTHSFHSYEQTYTNIAPVLCGIIIIIFFSRNHCRVDAN